MDLYDALHNAVAIYFAEQCSETLIRGVLDEDEVAKEEVYRDLELFIKEWMG